MTNAVPPGEFFQGVEQFNQQEFYACHDTLEALWLEALEPQKRFYQGILQIAVGCYHLGNLNWQGAVILLGEGIGRLRNYQEEVDQGIDVTGLLHQSVRLLKRLQETGPEQVADFVKQIESLPTNASDELNSTSVAHWPKIRTL